MNNDFNLHALGWAYYSVNGKIGYISKYVYEFKWLVDNISYSYIKYLFKSNVRNEKFSYYYYYYSLLKLLIYAVLLVINCYNCFSLVPIAIYDY